MIEHVLQEIKMWQVIRKSLYHGCSEHKKFNTVYMGFIPT